VRWGRKGVWKAVFDTLAQKAEDSLIFIDSSIVKAHRAAAESKRGNWQKVLDARAALLDHASIVCQATGPHD
jgi:transposase